MSIFIFFLHFWSKYFLLYIPNNKTTNWRHHPKKGDVIPTTYWSRPPFWKKSAPRKLPTRFKKCHVTLFGRALSSLEWSNIRESSLLNYVPSEQGVKDISLNQKYNHLWNIREPSRNHSPPFAFLHHFPSVSSFPSFTCNSSCRETQKPPPLAWQPQL